MAIASTVAPSGNPFIDSLLNGKKWDGATITYSFPQLYADVVDNEAIWGGDRSAVFRGLTAGEIAAVRSAIAQIAEVTGLTFVDAGNNGTGTLRLYWLQNLAENPTARVLAFPGDNGTAAEGDVELGDALANATWDPGNYEYLTILHELGHALGLKHPHDGDPVAGPEHDSVEFTMMSYRSWVGGPIQGYTITQGGYPWGPMMDDIAALQYMYGPNWANNSEDTTYTFDPSAPVIFSTIWDGGGSDTFNFVNYTTDLSIDLRAGQWSRLGGQLAELDFTAYPSPVMAIGNIANPRLYQGDTRSLIERAIGGAGNDTLVGNEAANELDGGAGNDILTGGAGNDTFKIGAAGGQDRITDLGWGDRITLPFALAGTINAGDGSAVAAGSVQYSVAGGVTTLHIDTDNIADAAELRIEVQFDGNYNGGRLAIVGTDLMLAVPVAPSAPVLDAASDTGTAGDNMTRITAPVIKGGGALPNAQVKLFDGAAEVAVTTADGSGNWKFEGLVLSEGSHTLRALQADEYGHASAQGAALALVIDATAPAQSLAALRLSADHGPSATDMVTNTGTQTIRATLGAPLGANDILRGSLDNGATWTDITAHVSGTELAWSGVTLSGNGTIRLALSDVAGNTGAGISGTYTIDTTAPAATSSSASLSADTGVSDADFITNRAAQTISGTLSASLGAGERVLVTLDGGASWTEAVAATGQAQWSLAGQVLSGAGRLQVKVADLAGNEQLVFTRDYVVDAAAPAATSTSVALSQDTGVSASDFITSSAAQTISGTLSASLGADERVLVSLDGGASWSQASASAGLAGWSLAGQTLAATGTLMVKVADVAGNENNLATRTYTVDATAPAQSLAALRLSADHGPSATDMVTNTGTQTIRATLGAPLGANDILRGSLDNGATWTDITAHVSGTELAWSGVTLSGSGTIRLALSDVAGNTGAGISGAYTIDTTAPAATSSSASLSADTGVSDADFITNRAAQTIGGTLSASLGAGERVLVTLDGGASWTEAVAATGQAQWSLAGQVLSGAGRLQVKVADLAGNEQLVFTRDYVVDAAAPAATSTSVALSQDTGVSASDFITSSAAQTISGTLSASLGVDERVLVSLDGGASWSQASASAGQAGWSLSGQTLAPTGTLMVKVADVAGNENNLATRTYTVDATAPAATASSAALSSDTGVSGSDFITATPVQTISGVLSAALGAQERVLVSLDGGASWTQASASAGQPGWSLAGQALPAAGTLQVKVADEAGNEQVVSTHAFALDQAAPLAAASSAALSNDSGVSDSDLVTNSASQAISGVLSANLAPGERVLVSLDGGASWSQATAASGQTRWSLAGQTLPAAGTLQVKVADLAGNENVVYTHAYQVDAVPPAATASDAALSADSGVSASDFVTAVAAQTIGGTLSASLGAGERVLVSLDDGASWAQATIAAGQAAWSLPGATLAGSGVLKVKVADQAGNEQLVFTRAYVLDNTAPAALSSSAALSNDSGASASDFITSAAAQAISGTLSANLGAGERVLVSLDGGATWTGATAAAGQAAWSLAGQTLPASGQLQVKVADLAGNERIVFTHGVTVDASAPLQALTGLALSADAGIAGDDMLTNVAEQTIRATLGAPLAPGDVVRGSLDDGASWTDITAMVNGTALGWTGVVLAGSSAIRIALSDVAGNTGTALRQAYTLDSSAPAATGTTVSLAHDTGISDSDFVTAVAAQDIQGSLSANLGADERVLVSLDGGATWAQATATAGQPGWRLAGQHLAASGSLQVKVADAAGNARLLFSKDYVLDTSAPVARARSFALSADSGALADDMVTRHAAQTLSGTLDAPLGAGERVEVSLDGGKTWAAAAAAAGQDAWTLAGQALAGSGTLTVRVVDAAGNVGAAAGRAYVLDTAGPAALQLSNAYLSTDAAAGTTVGSLLVSDPSERDSFSFALVDSGDARSADNASFMIANGVLKTTGTLSAGTRKVYVRVTDRAGNSLDKALTVLVSEPSRVEVVTETATVGGVTVTRQTSTGPDGVAQHALMLPMVPQGHDPVALTLGGTGQPLFTLNVPAGAGLDASSAYVPLGGASAQSALSQSIIERAGTVAAGAPMVAMVNEFLQAQPPGGQVIPLTIVPRLPAASAPLQLNGTGGTPTVVVVDATGAGGGSLQLDNVDAVVLMGRVSVGGGAGRQTVWGDDAAQVMALGDGDDVLHGGGGNDTVGGGAGADRIFGDAGDDIVAGGAGNDQVDGGSGRDTLQLAGHSRADYQFRVAGGKLVVTHRGGGIDGVDTVANVETLRFAPGEADRSVGGTVARLYDALLGREPDQAGREFWVRAHDSGMSLHQIAQQLVASAEGGQGRLDNGEFVRVLYRSALERDGSAAELAHWRTQLDQGLTDRATLALTIAESGERLALEAATPVLLDFNDSDVATLVRMYEVVFGRKPDEAGLNAWIAASESGAGMGQIATAFLGSREGVDKYGVGANGQFVDLLYHTALHRLPTAAERSHWSHELDIGTLSRGDVVLALVDSAELIGIAGPVTTSLPVF